MVVLSESFTFFFTHLGELFLFSVDFFPPISLEPYPFVCAAKPCAFLFLQVYVADRYVAYLSVVEQGGTGVKFFM